MLNRRSFTKLSGATALSGLVAPALRARHSRRAQPPGVRGNYLIKNGAVITVDRRSACYHARMSSSAMAASRRSGPTSPSRREAIDATDMIVMPGFVETHHHMWSSLGRNFVGDSGFGYFPAKAATSKLYNAEDSTAALRSASPNAPTPASRPYTTGRTTRARPPTPTPNCARTANRCCAPATPTATSTRCRATNCSSYADIDRVKREYFANGTRVRGSRHFRCQSARAVAERRTDLFRRT